MQWCLTGRCSTCHNGIKLRYPVASESSKPGAAVSHAHPAHRRQNWCLAEACCCCCCRPWRLQSTSPGHRRTSIPVSSALQCCNRQLAHAAAWPPRWRFFSGRPSLFSSLEFDGAFPAAAPAWHGEHNSQCVGTRGVAACSPVQGTLLDSMVAFEQVSLTASVRRRQEVLHRGRGAGVVLGGRRRDLVGRRRRGDFSAVVAARLAQVVAQLRQRLHAAQLCTEAPPPQRAHGLALPRCGRQWDAPLQNSMH